MQPEEISIEIYDSKEQVTTTVNVVRLSANVFRMIDNDIFDYHLIRGTEFETNINADGRHEITRILAKSPFITRRFTLITQFTESEYRLLGDEIIKHGGFWQVDFKRFATVNLPKESGLDLNEIFKMFNFDGAEITD